MLRVHVVSHTHWDREWYTTFEIFRRRLINLVDSLLEDKNPDFKHFMLDGQTVVLEDYLELKPFLKEKLIKAIRSGKISVGPWYVLPDEFLITGESFIRNFIYGQRVLEALRVPSMKVGYLPDMFGHNAYTPSILKGLGLEWAVLWRGVGKACRDTEFIWRAPNGDSVKVVNLIDGGYSNGAHFGRPIHEMKNVFKKTIDNLSKHAKTGNILIMNGTDHEMPYFELPSFFEDWGKELGVEFLHSTLEDYVKVIDSENPDLKEVAGELRDPTYEPVLKDVTSTRVYLKLLNFEDQILYTRYIEPLSTLKPSRDVLEALEKGWKEILKSHPHDSICGCSIDRVHRDVEVRLNSARELGLGVLSGILEGERRGEILTVYNPLEFSDRIFIEAYVFLKPGKYTLEDGEGRKFEAYVEGVSADEITDFTNVAGGYDHLKSFSVIGEFQRVKSVASVFSAVVGKMYAVVDLPKLSMNDFKLSETGSADPTISDGSDFENDFYEFELNDDGTFDLHDKTNGVSYSSLNTLVDIADCGDEYNFSPLGGDSPIKPLVVEEIESKENAIFKDIIVKGYLEIPDSLTEDRVSRTESTLKNPVVITYRLFKELPRIDITVDLTNLSKDHKLVAVFKSPERMEKVVNDGYFGIVERPIELEDDPSATEEIVSRYAMESFVAFVGKNSKFMLITRGLHEYETHFSNGGTELSLTLLRSVGWLSRGDLKTRKGNAGPSIPTPEAQCIGRYRFNYTFSLLERGDPEELYRIQRAVLLKPLVIHPGILNLSKLPVNFEAEDGIFLSALKLSRKGDGIVCRFFNVSDGDRRIAFGEKGEVVNMAEEGTGKYVDEYTMKPGEILGVKFPLKS